jgi:hypothetical protein
MVWCLTGHTTDARGVHEEVAAPTTFEKLEQLVFSTSIVTSGMTKAIVHRDRGYSFKSMEEINQFNVRSSDVIEGSGQVIVLREAPLESVYWWPVESPDGAVEFIRVLAKTLSAELSDPRSVVILRNKASALEKALAQRDLFQIYGLVTLAGSRAPDAGTRALAVRLERLIGEAFYQVLLSKSEYLELRELLPTRVPPHFAARSSGTLVEDYLPLRAIADDTSWTEVPARGKPFRHFRDYRGRSFIRVYIRAPEDAPQEFLVQWRELFKQYGRRLHTSAVRQRPAEGLETMLVRSFGVFLISGEYMDSYWPEEVILRIFKYSDPRMDHETSDFRGTLFYQYKLSRRGALAEPASLGLVRVYDDDVRFFGFFGDVPDPSNSYSDTVTTMRVNCISCHSELFYGLSTIFSFERDPDATEDPSNALISVQADGSYRLTTKEAGSLWRWIRGAR